MSSRTKVLQSSVKRLDAGAHLREEAVSTMTNWLLAEQDVPLSAIPSLLIVDDDRELTTMLSEYLSREGFAPAVAGNTREALTAIHEGNPDLVILDVMLGGASGLDLLKDMRRQNLPIPVLMLTAHGEETDRIIGLELGADDYLTKPFNPRELTARIRAILRRAVASPSDVTVHRVGNIELDVRKRSISVAGKPVDATGAEFGVLTELIRQAGDIVSRAELTERVLGRPLTLYDRSIDTHISNLRRKLETDQVRIRNVRGAGYVLTVGQSEEP